MGRTTIEQAEVVVDAYKHFLGGEVLSKQSAAAEIDKLIDAAVSDALAEQKKQHESDIAEMNSALVDHCREAAEQRHKHVLAARESERASYDAALAEAESRHATDKQRAVEEAVAESHKAWQQAQKINEKLHEAFSAKEAELVNALHAGREALAAERSRHSQIVEEARREERERITDVERDKAAFDKERAITEEQSRHHEYAMDLREVHKSDCIRMQQAHAQNVEAMRRAHRHDIHMAETAAYEDAAITALNGGYSNAAKLIRERSASPSPVSEPVAARQRADTRVQPDEPGKVNKMWPTEVAHDACENCGGTVLRDQCVSCGHAVRVQAPDMASEKPATCRSAWCQNTCRHPMVVCDSCCQGMGESLPTWPRPFMIGLGAIGDGGEE